MSTVWWHTIRSRIFRKGEWEWEHDFKQCPTGERHCPHIRWVRKGRG